MTSRLTKSAFEQLIEENIEAMAKAKPTFLKHGDKLEFEHIIDCLEALPHLEYEVVSSALRVHSICHIPEQCDLCKALEKYRPRMG